MILKNNYISSEEESCAIGKLGYQIVQEKWMDSSVIIVNCFPEYSSILTQSLNHLLSYLNKDELYNTIPLNIPYDNMTQVWNPSEQQYQNFDRYLKEWVEKEISDDYKYLFIINTITEVRSLQKIKYSLGKKINRDNIKFATLYIDKNCDFEPDYVVERREGNLNFYWENLNNKTCQPLPSTQKENS